MINGSGMWNELTIANLHIDKLFDTVGECRGIGIGHGRAVLSIVTVPTRRIGGPPILVRTEYYFERAIFVAGRPRPGPFSEIASEQAANSR